jgi:tRNA threonylcarbamoyladenosine biosynthesis protein TsaB
VSLLGIDTSTAVVSVCVLRADGSAFEADPAVADLRAPPAHARTLLPAVHGVMREAGVTFTELESIAVGIGPGGFTGLRIGIATARSLAAATRIGLRPVPSLAALAAGIPAALRLAVVDARRGEVFAALYSAPVMAEPDSLAELTPLAGPLVAPPDEAVKAAMAAATSQAAGTAPVEASCVPAGRTLLAAGDGSVRFREVLEAAGIDVAPASSELHLVRALHVCKLGRHVAPVAPDAVLPDYLRAPDATPAR